MLRGVVMRSLVMVLCAEVTLVTDAGQFLGFTLRSLMVAASAEHFHPRSGNATGSWRLPDRTVAEIIARAWE